MRKEELEVARDLRAGWRHLCAASSVTQLANAFTYLGRQFARLEPYLDQPADGDEVVVAISSAYWLELPTGDDDWYTPGCGYDMRTLQEALDGLYSLAEEHPRVRLTRQDETYVVVKTIGDADPVVDGG